MKKSLLISLLLLAFVLLGWFAARPAYRHYKERRAFRQGNAFLARTDYRNASLSARQTLALNPANVEACRLMAHLAELARAPQLLDWLRRINELEPSIDNKLALARAAIALERAPCPLAAQTLEELAPSATSSVPYHLAAAQLALKLGSESQAESHFRQAALLEPGNNLHRLNLAVLGLLSTNVNTQSGARASLFGLATDTNLASLALRSLVTDSLKRQDFLEAAQFSTRLLGEREVVFQDRLQHLTCLHLARDSRFEGFLAATQCAAETNPAAVYSLSAWMTTHDRARDCLDWLSELPGNVRSQPPVPLALADCYCSLRNWVGLQTFLEHQGWDELEFVRLALLSRAERELNQSSTAEAHWRLAIYHAGDRLGPLAMLLDLVSPGSSQQAKEEVLTRLVEKFPRQRWAYRDLAVLHIASGDTRALHRISSVVLAANPADFEAKNNLAATSMLLKVDLQNAHKFAFQNFEQHPHEPVVVATYAYSLYLVGRAAEGMAFLEKLSPEAASSSNIALYYALLLQANHQPAKAERYFGLVQSSKLLPEERELLAAAAAPHAPQTGSGTGPAAGAGANPRPASTP